MHGSNNEVAVLDAVLGSLAKSPAFNLFDGVEVPEPEPVPVFSIGYSDFLAHVNNL